MLGQTKFRRSKSYTILIMIGLGLNFYFLYHMLMLNEWLGHGISFLSVWNQSLYLTNISHLLICIYYLWNMLTIIQGSQQSEHLHKLYQFLVSLSAFISISYWIIRSIDPQLIHGKFTPHQLGEYYVIFIHGLNHLFLLFEVFIEDKYERIRSPFKFYATFLFLYVSILFINKLSFGRNVYAFQKLIGDYGSFIFLLAIPVIYLVDTFYTTKILTYFQSMALPEYIEDSEEEEKSKTK